MIVDLEAPPAPKAFAPARLAIWVGESVQATVAVRIFGTCGGVTVHLYTTTPTLGTGKGTVAAMVCAEHGCGLDYAGAPERPELYPTVAEAFAAVGYRTAGGPP